MNPLMHPLIVRVADAPAIKPAVELGTPLLLTIAAVGIAILLVMIIRFKIQAFVAESHGMRGVARESYAELAAEARDWKDADLVAAREACHHTIDFSALLPKVDRLLS